MRRAWTVAGDVALALAAVVGALCIVVFVCGFAFGMKVVLFSTGSMSPTIPAGAAAVTRQIPASEIREGDVVMVDRPGRLPITHRVVAVEDSVSPESRIIVMRGDANVVDDPAPYEVDEVGLVLFSVPGIAQAISSLRNPWVLAGATVAATALVVVVCLPRRGRRKRDPVDEPDAAPMTRRAKSVSCIALVLALVVAPSARDGSAEAASRDVEVVQGSVIRITSIRDASMNGILPGGEGVWQVGVTAAAPTPGVVRIALAGFGDAALGLQFDVRSCPVPWTADDCASNPAQILPEQPVPVDGLERQLLEMPDDDAVWLRIAVRMPAATDPDLAGQVEMRVRASGMGDDVATGSGGALAATGPRLDGMALAGAFAVVVVGIVLLARRRPA